MTAFRDIHSHFVYGIDDGAKDRETMEKMLDAAYRDNIGRLIATPHMSPGIQAFDMELFKSHYKQAQEYCIKKAYEIELLYGAENLYTPALPGYAESHDLVTLADSRYLLLEFVPDESVEEIAFAVDFLSARGYIPVIAHVERYGNLSFRDIKRLSDGYKVFFQMNCGTVIKDRGLISGRKSRRLLKSGLISCLGCDAHDLHRRPFNMNEAYAVIEKEYGQELANKLCVN